MAYDAATKTVVLFGGSANNALGDTWEWTGKTKTWTQVFPATSPSPRDAPVAYDPLTGEIVLFGGDNDSSYFSDTWTWDGITWTQRFPAGDPPALGASSLAYDASLCQVVLFGGRNGFPGVGLNETWAWNGSTWTQLQTLSKAGGRYAFPMDYDPLSGGLLVFGGWYECCTPLDETWLLVPVPLP